MNNRKQLLTEREKWEKGLVPDCVLESEGRVLVVLNNNPPFDDIPVDYHCHRYFTIGDEWVCSVDGQRVPLEAVWAWLMNPCAAATQKPYKLSTNLEDRNYAG